MCKTTLELGLARYTCSACGRVTFDKPHLVAVTCAHCGCVDLGTEIARNRWRTVLEARQRKAAVARGYCSPRAPVAGTRAGVALVAVAMILSLALVATVMWCSR